MRPILIGSQALRINQGLGFKNNSDFDFVSDKTVQVNGARTETHSPDVLLNEELERYVEGQTFISGVGVVDVLGLVGLSIVKRSHLHRDWMFEKHLTIYLRHLKQYRNLYMPEDYDYLYRRSEETKKYFKENTPKLNKTKEEFFNDFVVKKYDHDYLHELFAYYDRPLYESLQSKQNSVWCTKDRFLDLSYDDQNKTVAEECYVIATERFLIPSGWKHSEKHAFYKALKRVCTTLTSGWFRDHAIDNFEDIFALFDKSKVIKVKEKLNE